MRELYQRLARLRAEYLQVTTPDEEIADLVCAVLLAIGAILLGIAWANIIGGSHG